MRLAALLAGCVPLLLLAAARGDDPEPEPDEAVKPAQFQQPAPRPAPAPPAGVEPPDPATPVVRVQVRALAHVAPGKPIDYKITVTNPSQATAYKVKLRHPRPKDVTETAKMEPAPVPSAPAQPGAPPAEFVWEFKELRAGQSREVTFTHTPAAAANGVQAAAFVSFEHGESVLTEVERPKLAIRKAAPEKATAGEPIAVRVEVTNTGRVPVQAVQLVEDVGTKAEFQSEGAGEAGKSAGQRIWKLGTLQPGQRKLVEYKLTAKDAMELKTSSNVLAGGVAPSEPSESTTQVLAAKLRLDLTAKQATVRAGESAQYEIVVTNTGSLPLNKVTVRATIPKDCRVTRRSEGAQQSRDEVAWVIPNDKPNKPLQPGEQFALTLQLQSTTAGKRVLRVEATSGKSLEETREAEATFEASSLLQSSVELLPSKLAVGEPGTVTYDVTNKGSAAATGVQLRVTLPPEVKQVKITPDTRVENGAVVFAAQTLNAGDTIKYTITYEAIKQGSAEFRFELGHAGGKPTVADRTVTITPGK